MRALKRGVFGLQRRYCGRKLGQLGFNFGNLLITLSKRGVRHTQRCGNLAAPLPKLRNAASLLLQCSDGRVAILCKLLRLGLHGSKPRLPLRNSSAQRRDFLFQVR